MTRKNIKLLLPVQITKSNIILGTIKSCDYTATLYIFIIYINVYKIFVNTYLYILGSVLGYAELHGNLIFNHFRRY